MTDRQNRFLEGPINKVLISLAVPIILTNILQSAYQLTDAFWVGRLGASEVAAVSVSMPVTFLVIALGSGLAMAGATLSAQYMGAGRRDKVNHVAAQTMLMVAVTSVVLGLTGYLLSPYFLTLLGVSEKVYGDALKFMHVSFIGVIFVFLFAMFQSLMRGIGQIKIPLMIVFGTVILNFFLDPLFIFGLGSFEGQGVMGAALATLVTQSMAAILGLMVFMRGRHGIQLEWHNFKPDFAYIKKAFFLGVPGSVELSARALGMIILSFLVASFGTVTIASYGVGSNLLQFVMIPAMGLSMAVSTLVGQNIGANQIERAEKITLLGTLWGFLGLTVIGILFYVFAPHLIAVFIPDDPEVIKEGAHFLRTMCLTWGGIGVQLCVVSAFRASGNMQNAMMVALVSQWMVQFPLAYVLSKHTALQDNGIWWSFAVTNVVVAVFAFCWFKRGTWKKTRLTEEEQQIVHITDEALIEKGNQ
ncbi:MATE family efflux transporter [Photobacterium halotolerans]|uniref:Multidrug resistance protein NorM n=1 Tax=Photobacterium halotolerans TaxID=265726 RepID=A0A7X4WS78_9GAMM|nr:MATE family efflux transporter [Photobacterium halotolerans]NAW63685.1 MATE family efflux transporter [Photobacterium halotolerans]NAW87914.1 MATE family efflux transporter [Photobacterium halotolerans]